MTRTRAAIVLAIVGVVLGTLIVAVPLWLDQRPAPQVAAPASVADPDARKIKARLFYVANDGLHLTAVEQEIVYARETAEQARAILAAQFAAAAPPLVSAIPPGTTLRAVYLTPQGQAYVDVSQDLAALHPGGSFNEMLTVYTIVHALTLNLPAVTAVQVLVDGKELDTLAGHLDLRRPLEKRPTINVMIE